MCSGPGSFSRDASDHSRSFLIWEKGQSKKCERSLRVKKERGFSWWEKGTEEEEVVDVKDKDLEMSPVLPRWQLGCEAALQLRGDPRSSAALPLNSARRHLPRIYPGPRTVMP